MRDPEDIFKVLHDTFLQNELFGEAEAKDRDQMRQDILNVFMSDRDLQVLVMFDESDAFLWSDWNSGSRVVESPPRSDG